MADSSANKPTVLVVDDSRLMRVAARKILKNDFEIVEADDGETAWDALQQNADIDLVMSDLSMPNLDGLGLLKRIRESEDANLKDLPVIIVTGAEDDDGSKTTALSAGASDFITKPFESVQLLARAQAQAKQRRTEAALAVSEESKQKLQETTQVDPLTGLGNKLAFKEAAEESLSYAIRHQTDLALLLVQIDKYKILFLRRGKQVAEQFLLEISRLLSDGRRREDTVARIGLDTFGLLLPSANLEGAGNVAEHLLSRIAEHRFESDGEAVAVTASIAVSSPMSLRNFTAESLIEEADRKLKTAQAAGGNRVQVELAPTQPDAAAPPPEETVTAPLPAPVASSAELVRALEALSGNGQPEQDADSLIRAVMPLLKAWNRSRGGQHDALIAQLEDALDTGEEAATPATPSMHSA